MMAISSGYFTRYRHIAPLAMLRACFGAVLFVSTIRFIAKGWVYDFYIAPKFHFPFLGFEWLHPAAPAFMYVIYGTMALAALGICLGLFYRICSITFFICFAYAALLDKTYYLNHYYLVTIFSLLLLLTPAHRYFSLDVLRKPSLKITKVPAWTIFVFKCQLGIIYVCAGLSKLTSDWCIKAMPLKIWLPAKADVPLIGPLLKYEATAYLFSWAGALFDLSIVFLLSNKPTRKAGYLLVISFHLLTAMLFQIGMFPYLMMSATLIFFSEDFHKRSIHFFQGLFKQNAITNDEDLCLPVKKLHQQWVPVVLALYFIIQLALPFRFLLYPGNLLWTEEGYRFSWRVMLMEKGGTSFFYVKNPQTRKKFEVNNRSFLTAYQERMMETQPDMMLQYAHLLKQQYQLKGIANPEVTVESYVTLNGSGSRLYIDSTVNLANQQETLFGHKKWILPYQGKSPQQ